VRVAALKDNSQFTPEWICAQSKWSFDLFCLRWRRNASKENVVLGPVYQQVATGAIP
jgi:hypothetical protein